MDSQATEFQALTRRLQQGGVLSPDDVRAWCELGLDLGHPAAVQQVCEDLLAAPAVNSVLRPYWLFFLGTAYLHQLKIDLGVAALRQAVDALCDAPRVYNPQPVSQKFVHPRIEELLWQALAQLAAGGVRAFAHAGTLLGLVRDGRLLPFDKDIDLGVMVEDLPRARDVLLHHGWLLTTLPFTIDNMVVCHHPQADVVLDLCGLQTEGAGPNLVGGFWINNGVPLEWQRITRFPGPLQLALRPGPAGDVWQLQNPEQWLETIYGKAWRIPDPAFDTIIGAWNLVGFSSLTQWYAYSRICNAWLNGYWEKAVRLTRLVLERHTPDDPLMLRAAKTLETHLATIGTP
ncbi:LicD family protein [Paucimonas lemoignei]|uniref:LicD family protein n=1 Tax=Paucimonas lemoignei TaxID=29443 RepID=A0A4R3HYP1_PAULE|nr:LicD family protein [Paucimonas lemoignei]TCS37984.1 LicD family protein [Paucimonas lemoignei]